MQIWVIAYADVQGSLSDGGWEVARILWELPVAVERGHVASEEHPWGGWRALGTDHSPRREEAPRWQSQDR